MASGKASIRSQPLRVAEGFAATVRRAPQQTRSTPTASKRSHSGPCGPRTKRHLNDEPAVSGGFVRALCRTRTGDPSLPQRAACAACCRPREKPASEPFRPLLPRAAATSRCGPVLPLCFHAAARVACAVPAWPSSTRRGRAHGVRAQLESRRSPGRDLRRLRRLDDRLQQDVSIAVGEIDREARVHAVGSHEHPRRAV